MNIKIDQADKIFSQYVRLRDRQCMRCHSQVILNDNGLPISHNASHFFGRGRETTRFDPKNVDCLCFPCHQKWGGDEREAYRQFKINQLGKSGFQKLQISAEMVGKKDRKTALIYVKQLLKSL